LIRLLAVLMLLAIAACAAVPNDSRTNKANATDEPTAQILVLLNLPPAHFRIEGTYSGSYDDAMGRSARRRVVEQLAREHGLSLVTDWPMPLLGVDCYVLAVPAQQTPGEMAAVLSRDTRVEWAQPMNTYRAQGHGLHGDPLYAMQPAATAWRLSEVHQRATGRGVSVAVVDSGVEATHPDLLGQVEYRENFVAGRSYSPERHGTGVAGIVAANADNGVGIVGVAPRARLMALRACWQESLDTTLCNTLSLARALHFAVTRGAQVINMSLSGPPDRLLGLLLDVAMARGIVVVGAVDPALPDGGYPASHHGVVAVADQVLSPVSGQVLTAPGVDVPTTVPEGRWSFVSGSSYAAAHVAGLFALLRELGTTPSASLTSADVVRLPNGRIDACATLARGSVARACSSSLADTTRPVAR